MHNDSSVQSDNFNDGLIKSNHAVEQKSTDLTAVGRVTDTTAKDMELRSSQVPDNESDVVNLTKNQLKKSLRKNTANSQRFESNKKELFIKTLRIWYPNVWKACVIAGVHKETVLAHMEKDEEFGKACAEVAEEFMDSVEGFMGTMAFTEKGFLDRIAILKANRPEKWNPTNKVEVTHKKDSPEDNERRRAVLARVVAEDADVIEAMTGRHVAALPPQPEDIPPDPELMINPDPPPEIHDSSNARAGVRSDLDLDTPPRFDYTPNMRLNPFDLSKKPDAPPKKPQGTHPTKRPSPSHPSQKIKKGPLQ